MDALTGGFSFSEVSVVKVFSSSILYLKGNIMVDFINTLSSNVGGLGVNIFEFLGGIFDAANDLFNDFAGSSADDI